MSPHDTSDLLRGYIAIGKYLSMDGRQAKYRAVSAGLPVFRLGRTVCARRATLDAWLADQERSQSTGAPKPTEPRP